MSETVMTVHRKNLHIEKLITYISLADTFVYYINFGRRHSNFLTYRRVYTVCGNGLYKDIVSWSKHSQFSSHLFSQLNLHISKMQESFKFPLIHSAYACIPM